MSGNAPGMAPPPGRGAEACSRGKAPRDAGRRGSAQAPTSSQMAAATGFRRRGWRDRRLEARMVAGHGLQEGDNPGVFLGRALLAELDADHGVHRLGQGVGGAVVAIGIGHPRSPAPVSRSCGGPRRCRPLPGRRGRARRRGPGTIRRRRPRWRVPLRAAGALAPRGADHGQGHRREPQRPPRRAELSAHRHPAGREKRRPRSAGRPFRAAVFVAPEIQGG